MGVRARGWMEANGRAASGKPGIQVQGALQLLPGFKLWMGRVHHRRGHGQTSMVGVAGKVQQGYMLWSWSNTSAKSSGGRHENRRYSPVRGCLNLQKNGICQVAQVRPVIWYQPLENWTSKYQSIETLEKRKKKKRKSKIESGYAWYPSDEAWRQGLCTIDKILERWPWWLEEVLGLNSESAMLLVPPYTSSPNRGIPRYFACARIYFTVAAHMI